MFNRFFTFLFFIFLIQFSIGQNNTTKIPFAEIEDEVKAFVKQQLHHSNIIKYEITNLKIPTSIIIPTKNYRLSIQRNSVYPPKGNTVVLLKISVNDKIIKSATIYFKLKTWEKVYKTKSNIKKNTILTSQHIKADTVETTSLRKGYIQNIGQIVKNKASKTIFTDKILYLNDIVEPSIINRGDNIELLYEKGTIKIVVKATSLQNGKIGDFIWVKNLQSGKKLKAQIVELGKVKIQ